MKTPIKIEVSRNGMKKRYEVDFFKDGIQWAMFLDDTVYNDPKMFSVWIKSMIQDIHLRA